jgi:hypothetical protein
LPQMRHNAFSAFAAPRAMTFVLLDPLSFAIALPVRSIPSHPEVDTITMWAAVAQAPTAAALYGKAAYLSTSVACRLSPDCLPIEQEAITADLAAARPG